MNKKIDLIGKDKMVEDWNRVMVSILRAQSGESDFNYRRNDDGGVIGLRAEMLLQFAEGLPPNRINDLEYSINNAKTELANAVTERGEFTSKQRMLIDWMSIKNSIIRAQSGEIKVTLEKNPHIHNHIVAVAVELELDFGTPTKMEFTNDEKVKIDDAKGSDQ